ncbi:hypothetical protein BT93_G0644 [Corymbia citriodora subsp. variegata]|nr:hypothetical protein BT93_G0644 [Corymbia citriodora subsp. variegata]
MWSSREVVKEKKPRNFFGEGVQGVEMKMTCLRTAERRESAPASLRLISKGDRHGQENSYTVIIIEFPSHIKIRLC